MSEQKRNTIFKQLILNIIIPVAIALSLVAVVNSFLLYDIESGHEEKKNELVTDEIKNILEFQDVALNLIESSLNAKIEDYSHQYFSNTSPSNSYYWQTRGDQWKFKKTCLASSS